MKKILVVLSILMLCGCGNPIEQIENKRELSSQRTAEFIRDEVKLAYTEYIFDVPGEKPSDLCDFMNDKYFEMDNAVLKSCDVNKAIINADEIDYTLEYSENKISITSDFSSIIEFELR